MNPDSTLLSRYDDELSVNKQFLSGVSDLIARLLAETTINVHSIESRVKTRQSLKDKIESRGTKYDTLDSITDICGIRVITYYSDEVDKVASLIRSEFEVDDANSVDKRSLLDPDRFGYLSLHFIVSLSHSRCKLIEYRGHAERKAEIQIRSMLQHTWAEIEHDLGYKTKNSVPRSARRQFSRLAGILELADAEFTALRHQLNNYEATVDQLLEASPSDLSLDAASLEAFIKRDQTLARLDKQLAEIAEAQITHRTESMNDLADELGAADIHSIQELKQRLDLHKDAILSMGKSLFSTENYHQLYTGTSLVFLTYCAILEEGSPRLLEQHLASFGSASRIEPSGLARRLSIAYDQSKKPDK